MSTKIAVLNGESNILVRYLFYASLGAWVIIINMIKLRFTLWFVYDFA